MNRGARCAYQQRFNLLFYVVNLSLEATGTDMNHAVHARIYVRGELAEHLGEFGPIVAERLGSARPALTSIGVASLATPDKMLEIEICRPRTAGVD